MCDCKCGSFKPIKIEDQSRNGVKVLVSYWPDGTTVEADCNCFGFTNRAHSTEDCPVTRNFKEVKIHDHLSRKCCARGREVFGAQNH